MPRDSDRNVHCIKRGVAQRHYDSDLGGTGFLVYAVDASITRPRRVVSSYEDFESFHLWLIPAILFTRSLASFPGAKRVLCGRRLTLRQSCRR